MFPLNQRVPYCNCVTPPVLVIERGIPSHPRGMASSRIFVLGRVWEQPHDSWSVVVGLLFLSPRVRLAVVVTRSLNNCQNKMR